MQNKLYYVSKLRSILTKKKQQQQLLIIQSCWLYEEKNYKASNKNNTYNNVVKKLPSYLTPSSKFTCTCISPSNDSQDYLSFLTNKHNITGTRYILIHE